MGAALVRCGGRAPRRGRALAARASAKAWAALGRLEAQSAAATGACGAAAGSQSGPGIALFAVAFAVAALGPYCARAHRALSRGAQGSSVSASH